MVAAEHQILFFRDIFKGMEMEPEIQTHILGSLDRLNTAVATIGQSQKDLCERIDKIVPWVQKVSNTAEEAKDSLKDIQGRQTILAWKLGTISAGAGAALAFCGQWLAFHLFGVKVK